MARYIDVDKFTEDLRSQHCLNCVSYDGLKCKTCEIDDTIAFVESTPTADVVEVKHGKWIKDNNKRTCSECGYYYFANDVNTKYCAECGTAMFDKLEISTKG